MPPPSMYDMHTTSDITRSLPSIGGGAVPLSVQHSLGTAHLTTSHTSCEHMPSGKRSQSDATPGSKVALESSSQQTGIKPNASRSKRRRTARAQSSTADSQGSDNSMRMPRTRGESETPPTACVPLSPPGACLFGKIPLTADLTGGMWHVQCRLWG